MPSTKTELEKRKIVRMSNDATNRITRECIQTALLQLLNDKDIDKISISELTRRAGVSRTAFYNNYSSKEDVLVELSEDILERLTRLTIDALSNEKSRYETYLHVFKNIKSDTFHFKMLLDTGLAQRETVAISDYVTDHYPGLNPQIRKLIFAWGGMIRGVMLDWFNTDMGENIEEIAHFCADISSDIVKRIKSLGGLDNNTDLSDGQ